MKQLSKHFHIDEFACKDKARTGVPKEYMNNIKELALNLEVLRVFLNKPINITSGYRTPEYNASVGGKPSSKHMVAQAADIQVAGMSPEIIGMIIEGLIRIGVMKQGGLSVYPTFVHYDVRGTKARW